MNNGEDFLTTQNKIQCNQSEGIERFTFTERLNFWQIENNDLVNNSLD